MKTAPVPPAIQQAINRFNMTQHEKQMQAHRTGIIKALYEKESTGLSFPEWLAAKHNGRVKNSIAKSLIVQPQTNLGAYIQTIQS
jgi:hypothetical protein